MIDLSLRPRLSFLTPDMLLVAGMGPLGIEAQAVCELCDDLKWLDEQMNAGLLDAQEMSIWHAELVRRNREVWGVYCQHGCST